MSRQNKFTTVLVFLGFVSLLGVQGSAGLMTQDLLTEVKPMLNPGEVETILDLAPNNWPEGIALDSKGNIFVGNRKGVENSRIPEILKISPDGTVAVHATLPPTSEPDEESLLGLAADEQGNVYAALHSQNQSINGVWLVRADGSTTRIAGTEGIIFPNALIFDPRGNLYVTDSIAGMIWHCDRNHNCTSWLQDELLAPDFANPFNMPLPGANGIAFYPPNQLYVANTSVGSVIRIIIQPDGSPGEVTKIAETQAILTTGHWRK